MTYFYYISYVFNDGEGRAGVSHVEYNSPTPLATLADLQVVQVGLSQKPHHGGHSGFEITNFQLLRTVHDADVAAAVEAANAQRDDLDARIKEAAQILRGQAEMFGKKQKASLLAVVKILEP